MSILSEYETLLETLKNKFDYLLSFDYSHRDFPRIEMFSDEICDVEFAIAEMRKASSNKSGYRPRRNTILTRADFYRGLD